MEANTRGSSQPRPVIHGNAAERAELAGAATPLQSTAASTPVVRPSCTAVRLPRRRRRRLSLSAAVPLCAALFPSFRPSLRRNFAPRRWNSFVQIKSAAWKYHACLPAKAPTSLNMTKVADGLLAFPLEGTGGASEGQKSTPHTLPWESGSGTLAANYRKKQQRSTMQQRRQGYERREAKQSCKHFECENLCHPYPDFPGKTKRM